MQIVVPMAGAGQRFVDAGYKLPKPLIPISGVPMVVRAVRDLPPATRLIFVCHPDHVAQHKIDRTLVRYFPDCRVVVAPGLTAGQACSVRLAGDLLDKHDSVLVAACDNTHLYNHAKLQTLTKDPQVDCAIWTYRHDPRVLQRPQAYGWVQADEAGNVDVVSVKRPLSDTPLVDHVVSGTFWFRTAGMMLDGIDQLLDEGTRVNNEFYLDSVPNVLLDEGYRVVTFETDKYIGWGTPEDLQDYSRWQQYFGTARAA